MIKKIVVTMLALIVVGAWLNVAAATPTSGHLVCTGTVTGTYTDDGDKPKVFDYHSVSVPKGATCTLLNVAVKGNVKALHGAVDVKVLDSYVGNNVHVKNATGLVHVGQKGCKFDPTVRVNVLVYNSHHVLVCWVNAHNIQLKRNDGRITVRDSQAHRIDVSRNRKCVGCANGHRRPDAIRILRNTSETHIHLFRNHRSRDLIVRGNNVKAVVK